MNDGIKAELVRGMPPVIPRQKNLNQKTKDFFIVLNEKGLHTRPATELVKCAAAFKAQITLHYQDLSVNAKSLLGILMLAAARGARIRIDAEGEDAEEAVNALVTLAKSKFYMNY